VSTEGSKIEFVKKLKQRTKNIGLDAINLFRDLPKTEEARIIGRQFLRSSLSVGANYRAVCRARSKREYFAKLSITVEEADETLHWIEMMEEGGILQSPVVTLKNEVHEIVKILARARKNTSV